MSSRLNGTLVILFIIYYSREKNATKSLMTNDTNDTNDTVTSVK